LIDFHLQSINLAGRATATLSVVTKLLTEKLSKKKLIWLQSSCHDYTGRIHYYFWNHSIIYGWPEKIEKYQGWEIRFYISQWQKVIRESLTRKMKNQINCLMALKWSNCKTNCSKSVLQLISKLRRCVEIVFFQLSEQSNVKKSVGKKFSGALQQTY